MLNEIFYLLFCNKHPSHVSLHGVCCRVLLDSIHLTILLITSHPPRSMPSAAFNISSAFIYVFLLMCSTAAPPPLPNNYLLLSLLKFARAFDSYSSYLIHLDFPDGISINKGLSKAPNLKISINKAKEAIQKFKQ